jgi:hypothetical protein
MNFIIEKQKNIEYAEPQNDKLIFEEIETL